MTKGDEKRDVRFSFRMPESLHDRLLKVSAADRRTMADFVLIAVEKAVEEFEAAAAEKAAKKPGKLRS